MSISVAFVGHIISMDHHSNIIETKSKSNALQCFYMLYDTYKGHLTVSNVLSHFVNFGQSLGQIDTIPSRYREHACKHKLFYPNSLMRN